MHIAHMHSALSLYYVNFGCIALPWVASLDGPSCKVVVSQSESLHYV